MHVHVPMSGFRAVKSGGASKSGTGACIGFGVAGPLAIGIGEAGIDVLIVWDMAAAGKQSALTTATIPSAKLFIRVESTQNQVACPPTLL